MSFPPSTLDARTQAFPALTSVQIDRIRPLGYLRRVLRGEILFEPGDTKVPFFVLLSGSMEIVQPSLEGERPVATHAAGEFTGEITMISGQRCLVRGRVTEKGEFLEVMEWPTSPRGQGRGTERNPDARLHATTALIQSGFGMLVLMGHNPQRLWNTGISLATDSHTPM